MEDKCGVEAGRLDSDGSVCEIYFKVHFRFKELELYLSPYKNTEWPFSQNGPIKFYGIVSFLFFFPDIVSYTAGCFSSFYWDENKNWLLCNEMQLMKRTLLLRANVQQQKMEKISSGKKRKEVKWLNLPGVSVCGSLLGKLDQVLFLVNPLFMR